MSRENFFFTGKDGFLAFANLVGLSADETESRGAALDRSFMPFRVSAYYADLIRRSNSPDRNALLNIVLPPPNLPPYRGRFDPYGNLTYSIEDRHKFLQHKYAPTLLLHITDFCNSNCQFCYKVNEIKIEHSSDYNSKAKVAEAISYLDHHPEVDNVLFTGGDPAAIRPELLIRYIDPLIKHPRIRIVRFATKTLAFDPSVLRDDNLLRFFERVNGEYGKQVSIIAQINHPAELAEDARRTATALHQAGVQVRGQPAIIRGVNEDVETLVRLHKAFVDSFIIPYYFTLFMPVRGVEQYGITLREGFVNFNLCSRRLNGLEKKSVLLTSHDFGKIEIVGFTSGESGTMKIILRWHEVVDPKYLPTRLKENIPHEMGSTFILDYPDQDIYCADHLFAANRLPYYNEEGKLVEMAANA